MNTSKIRVEDEIDPDQILERLMHIGAGDLDLWKYTVLTDEKAFGKVYEMMFSKDAKVAWRSAWIIDCSSEDYPELLEPHLTEIISHFFGTNNSSLLRIYTRMLSRYRLPEEFLGKIIDRCYSLISPLHPVAVRVNAMQVLYNIAVQEPDLKPELLIAIDGIIEEGGTAGLMNKAEKLYKKLAKGR
jgi:hypothetical protein